MPELPEVEITRRHLAAVLDGAILSDVHVSHPRTARHNSGPSEVEARLQGRRLGHLLRTGKFLHCSLDDGQVFVAHLGMSGRFTIDGDDEPHTHFRCTTDRGATVRFVDPRTFGFVAVFDSTTDADSLSRLGFDAWDSPPTGAQLGVELERRSASIKALLLDQGIIAGLGNIYADEALHLAGIHPLRSGASLDRKELEALLGAVREVLEVSLEHGGTSLDDLAYLLPDGRAGDNLNQLRVYGRADLPCVRCGSIVQRLVVRGRSTYFCPECQRGPR